MPYASVMDAPHAVAAMQALGHEARLAAFRALVRAGSSGLTVAEIQDALDGMPRSTLAHHLGKLVAAGLVQQERRGAEVVSRARYDAVDDLVAYLTDECCSAERPPAGAVPVEPRLLGSRR
jgi:DNA-binding transcriptional ArsR family regulator